MKYQLILLITIILITILSLSHLTAVYSINITDESPDKAIENNIIEYEKIDLERSGISSSGSSGNWLLKINLQGNIIGAIDSNMNLLNGKLNVFFFIDGHQGSEYQNTFEQELIFNKGIAEFIIEDWLVESEAEGMSILMPADLRLSIP